MTEISLKVGETDILGSEGHVLVCFIYYCSANTLMVSDSVSLDIIC